MAAIANDALATMVWKIKNFDMSPCMPEEPMCSPEFNVGSYRFCLRLYPRGMEISQAKTFISLFLRRVDNCETKKILINYSFCIVNDKKELKSNLKISGINFTKDHGFGRPNFIKRDVVLTTERHSLLPDNNLTVKCEILGLEIQDDSQSEFEDNLESEILSNNFSEIFKSGLYADMVINANGEKFKVHKIILQNRCPKLFEYLEENDDHEYSLEDVKASVFQAVLEYLYSGNFNLLNLKNEVFDFCAEYEIFSLEHDLKLLHSITFTSITEIPVSELCFRWVIPDFSKLKVNQELVYPKYWSDKIDICLTTIKGQSGSRSLQLKFKKIKNCKIAFIRCKITFSESSSGKTLKDYEYVFIGTDWITPLGSQVDLCEVLSNDTLNMFLNISTSSSDTNSNMKEVSVANFITEKGVKNLKLLQKDFHRLYNDMPVPDVTVCVGGETHYAHKLFLCARSPVFARMFENDCLENKEGAITIRDIDSKTVSKLLLYMYCGYIYSVDSSDALKLYAAADKYALLTIKDKFAMILKNAIDNENVGDILLIADRHQDEMLKTCICDFITSNPKQILESTNILNALETRVELCLDILKNVLNRFPSEK